MDHDEISLIAQALHEDRLIICLGPQLDSGLGIPSFEEVLEPLNTLATEADRHLLQAWREAEQLSRMAEYFYRNHRTAYAQRLRKAYDLRPGFAHRPRPDWVNTLMALAPKHLVMTRPHNLLSLLFPDHQRLLWDETGGLAALLPSGRPWLCYTHGVIDEPSSLVLTHGQAQAHTIKIDRGLRRQVLESLFGKHWLFCGFAPNDPLIGEPQGWAAQADLRFQAHILSLDGGTSGPVPCLALKPPPETFTGSAHDHWWRRLADHLNQPLPAPAQPKTDTFETRPPFTLIRRGTWTAPPAPSPEEVKDYYSGSLPTLALVHHGHTVPRTETHTILKLQQEGKSVVLLTGASGEGKNTVVLQVARELLEHNWDVCLVERTDPDLIARVRHPGAPLAVLVYRADQYTQLDQLVHAVRHRGDNGFLLLAARPHEWAYRNRLHGRHLNLRTVEMAALSPTQQQALVAKLRQTHPHLQMGKLKQILKRGKEPNLFAAMLAATHGKNLKQILADMADRLANRREGKRLLDALGLVSLFEACLGEPCPRRLFASFLNLAPNEIDGFCTQLTGELTLRHDNKERVGTRHITIGKALFGILFREEPRLEEARLVEDALWALSPLLTQESKFHERKLLTTLPKLYQKANPDLAEHLFQIAAKINPRDVYVWQTWAMLAKKRRPSDSLNEPLSARWLFQRATEADPQHAPSWQAWAILEKEQKYIGDRNTPHSARWLFQRATEADPKHAPSWQAWAILETEQGNVGEVHTPYSARWLFQRATEVDPQDAASWQAWITMEAEDGHRDTALQLLQSALHHNPKDQGLQGLQKHSLQVRKRPTEPIHLDSRPESEYGRYLYACHIAKDSEASAYQILDALDGILPLLEKPCLVMNQSKSLEEDPQLMLAQPRGNGWSVFVATSDAKLMHFTLSHTNTTPPATPPEKLYEVPEFLGHRDEVLGLYAYPSAFKTEPDLILACRIHGADQSFIFSLSQWKQPPHRGDQMPHWMTQCPVQIPSPVDLPTAPPHPHATSAVWTQGKYHWTTKEPNTWTTEPSDNSVYGDFIHRVGAHLLTITVNQSITAYDLNHQKLWRWFTDRQVLCMAPLGEDSFLIGEDGGHIQKIHIMPGGRGWGKKVVADLLERIKAVLKVTDFQDLLTWAKKFLTEGDLSRWPKERRAPKAAVLYLLIQDLIALKHSSREAVLQEVAQLFQRLYIDAEFLWLMPPIRHRIRKWTRDLDYQGASIIFKIYQVLPYTQQDVLDLEIQRHLIELEAPLTGPDEDQSAYDTLTRHALVNRKALLELPIPPDKRAAIALETHLEFMCLGYTSRAAGQEVDGVLRRLSTHGTLHWILQDRIFLLDRRNPRVIKNEWLHLPFTPIVRIALVVQGKPALFLANSTEYLWFWEGDPHPQGQRFQTAHTLLLGTAAGENRVLLVFKDHGDRKLTLTLLDLTTNTTKGEKRFLHTPSELAVLHRGSGKFLVASNVHHVGIELDELNEHEEHLKIAYKGINRKFYGRIHSLVSVGPEELLVGTTEGILHRLSCREEEDGIKAVWHRYLGSPVKHLDCLEDGAQLWILALTADGDAYLLDRDGKIHWRHRVHTVFRSGALFKDGEGICAALTDVRGALAVFKQTTPVPLSLPTENPTPAVHDSLKAIALGAHPERLTDKEFGRHRSMVARLYLTHCLAKETYRPNLEKIVPLLNPEEVFCLLRAWKTPIPEWLNKVLVINLNQPRHQVLYGDKWPSLRARILEEILFRLSGTSRPGRERIPAAWPMSWFEHPAVAAAWLRLPIIEGDRVVRFSRLLEAGTFLGPRGLLGVGMIAPASKTKLSYFLIRSVSFLGGRGPRPTWRESYDEVKVVGEAKALLLIIRLLTEEHPSWEAITHTACEVIQTCPKGFTAMHPDLKDLWQMLKPLAIDSRFAERPVSEQLALLSDLESQPLPRSEWSESWAEWLNQVRDRFNHHRQTAMAHRRTALQSLRRGLLRHPHLQRLSDNLAVFTAELAGEGPASANTQVFLEVQPLGARLFGNVPMSRTWTQLPIPVRWPLTVDGVDSLILKIRTVDGTYIHEETYTYAIPGQPKQAVALVQMPILVSEWVSGIEAHARPWMLAACDASLGLMPLAEGLTREHPFRICDLDDVMSRIGPSRERAVGFHAETILKTLGLVQADDTWVLPRIEGRQNVVVWPCTDTVRRLLAYENRYVLQTLTRHLEQLKVGRVVWLLPWEAAQQLQVHTSAPLHVVCTLSEKALTQEELGYWLTSSHDVPDQEVKVALERTRGDLRLLSNWLRHPQPWPEYVHGYKITEAIRQILEGLSYGAYAFLIQLSTSRLVLQPEDIGLDMTSPLDGTTGEVYGCLRKLPSADAHDGISRLLQTVSSEHLTRQIRFLVERRIIGQTSEALYLQQPFLDWFRHALDEAEHPFEVIDQLLEGTLRQVLGLPELATLGPHATKIYPQIDISLLEALKHYFHAPDDDEAQKKLAAFLGVQNLVPVKPPTETQSLLAQLGCHATYNLSVKDTAETYWLCFLHKDARPQFEQLNHPTNAPRLVLLGPGLLRESPPSKANLLFINQVGLLEMVSAPNPQEALRIILRNSMGLLPFSPFRTANRLPEDSEVFVGRREEIETIMDHYLERSFLILGGRQIGKTSLLQNLLGRMKKRATTHPLYLDCQGVRSIPVFLRKLREAAAAFPYHLPNTDEVDTLLKAMATQHPLTLLINEVDGLSRKAPSLLQDLRSLSENGICQSLMVGYQGAYGGLTQPDHPFFHWVYSKDNRKAFTLGALTRDAAVELINKLSESALALRWQDDETHALGLQILLERSHRIPILLQRACQSLVERLDKARRSVITRQDFEELYSGNDLPAWKFINEIRLETGLAPSSDTLDQYLAHWLLALAVYYRYQQDGEDHFARESLQEADPRGLYFETAEVPQYIARWCGPDNPLTKGLAAWPIDHFRHLLDLWSLTVVLSNHPNQVQAYYFTEHVYPLELRAHLRRSNLTLFQHIQKLEAHVRATLGTGDPP